jgi:hypothetical protein
MYGRQVIGPYKRPTRLRPRSRSIRWNPAAFESSPVPVGALHRLGKLDAQHRAALERHVDHPVTARAAR